MSEIWHRHFALPSCYVVMLCMVTVYQFVYQFGASLASGEVWKVAVFCGTTDTETPFISCFLTSTKPNYIGLVKNLKEPRQHNPHPNLSARGVVGL